VIVPDVNLLLYAYDDASRFHEAASRWWAERLSGAEPIGLTHPVIFAFIRISTSPAAFRRPSSLKTAAERVAEWLERRITRILQEGSDHVQQVVALLDAAGSSGGNLVADAQIAALAMAHRAVVHTADRDFQRFPGLDCRFPLHEHSRK
jgi:toxin-antitoxin system PIN domain toxin